MSTRTHTNAAPPTSHPGLAKINAADDATAAELLVRFVENAPMLARHVAKARPFADADRLADAIATAIVSLSMPDLLNLFCGHPELAPARPDAMTPDSQGEQARLSLTRADSALRARLADLNTRYRARFGFPFIIALHRVPDTDALLRIFDMRLTATTPDEITTTCAEIASVSRARVMAALSASAERRG